MTVLFFFLCKILLWINQTIRADIVKNLLQIFLCQIFGHAKIHIQVVSAVFRGSAGNLAAVVADELEHFDHQRQNLFGRVVSGEQKVKTGTAAHGAEVENAGFPGLMVP